MKFGFAFVLAVAGTGCSFTPGTVTGDGRDARRDGAGSDAADGCFGTAIARVCVAPPALSLHITLDTMINTSASSSDCMPLLAGGTIDACVIGGTDVTVDSAKSIRATGSRPLVIVSSSTIRTDGSIDVASRRGTNAGAGAQPGVCETGTAATYNQSGAGGSGGSFAGQGGDGGDAELGVGSAAAAKVITITALRGGCKGTGGGTTSTAGGGGANGGGAVMLIATTSITIAGTINASGAGANPGTGGDSGGGGGGSGGMIAFDAPTVTSLSGAKIFSNGGGGGEGYETTAGNPGADPLVPSPAAVGGVAGSLNGGDGGKGSQTVDGFNGFPGASNGGGGGGGGGGRGVIIVYPTQALAGGAVMPPEQ